MHRGAHHEAPPPPQELIPGNPTGPNPFLMRRQSSTAAQFAHTFARSSSQSIDGNIQALLALSDTLAKEIPANSAQCRYLIGVKTTVNDKECITLCSDRVLEEDPHADRLAELTSDQVSREDKKKILSAILESRQEHKDSTANLHLKKLIDTIEKDPSLTPETIIDMARTALQAVRLEDIATAYKPEEGSEAHRLIQDAQQTLKDDPEVFHDEDLASQILDEIKESVSENGMELAEHGLKQLLKDVLKSPCLPKEGAASEAIKKVIDSAKELSSHLETQVFQGLVEKIKQDLPGQAQGSGSFDAELPARRKTSSRENSASQVSLLSLGLSRQASLADVPEEGGIPLPLRECSNKLVSLYYGNMDALIKLSEEKPHDDATSSKALELAEKKEAVETLLQYRSHELTTKFKDNTTGLIEHQMAQPNESGEYRAAKRALDEIVRLSANAYRNEYKNRPEELRAEREKLASSMTDSDSAVGKEAVNNAVVKQELKAMDEVLAELDAQKDKRIKQRSESLFLKFLSHESLEAHKAGLIKNDPAFEGTEECAAIDKAIEMMLRSESLD